MNETLIIDTALKRLQVNTGITGKWTIHTKDIDGEMELFMPAKNKNEHFFVVIKTEIRLYHLPRIFELAKKHKPLIVVADKIFPTLKEKLREQGIAYLDTAGNLFIQTPKNYIWIDGHKATQTIKTASNRAFTKIGLKTVFYLLLHEEAINLPHRQLATLTGTAIGNITNVMEGLKEAGNILQIAKGKVKLVNKKALLQRWIAGYGETLRPTLALGTFRMKGLINLLPDWENMPIDDADTVWGGEPAANILTNYLVPGELIAYTTDRMKVIREWKLLPDNNGLIKLYAKFWKAENENEHPIAPIILIYADLILTNDPRCLETAIMIYDKYLKEHIGNN